MYRSATTHSKKPNRRNFRV